MKLKTLYLVHLDSPEVQGMFDASGKLLDWWFCNDADWRGEYFSGVMARLGYVVHVSRAPKLQKQLAKLAEDYS
jgi:hypothetical protein